MSLFGRPHYTSEFTQFLEQYKQDHPGLEARQRAGRALLWDKIIDRDEALSNQKSNLPQQGYVYLTSPSVRDPADDMDRGSL